VRRPGPDAGHLGEGGLDLVVGHPSERVVAQASVDEAFRECAQRPALPRGEPAGAEDLRIRCEQFRGGRQVSFEALLEPGQDRSCRPDGELLAGDLEDERAEGVEAGELVDPRPWMEVRMRVDHAREHRIGVPEELARPGIGDGSGGHAFSSRSVSTISMT